jgi:hypothetical protein
MPDPRHVLARRWHANLYGQRVHNAEYLQAPVESLTEKLRVVLARH